MLLLDKLDPQRYAGMLAHLTNDATLGRALPQTLHAAWSIASGWKSASTKIAGGSDMQSVFMLADDATGPPRNPKAGRGAGRGAGERASQRDHKRPSTGVNTAPKPSSTSTGSETRTCRGCLVKGHLYRDCPDNLDRATAKDSKILIATGENDTADIDVYNSAAFLIEDAADVNATKTVTSDAVFFSATEASSRTDHCCATPALSYHSTSEVSMVNQEA